MKRRLSNLATIVSLIFLLAAIFVWIRSYWIEDEWRTMSVGAAYSRKLLTMHDRILVIPTAIPTLAFGILPGAWLKRLRKNHRIASRRKRGLCTRCGYDLRASPGRCSECGLVQMEAAVAQLKPS